VRLRAVRGHSVKMGPDMHCCCSSWPIINVPALLLHSRSLAMRTKLGDQQNVTIFEGCDDCTPQQRRRPHHRRRRRGRRRKATAPSPPPPPQIRRNPTMPIGMLMTSAYLPSVACKKSTMPIGIATRPHQGYQFQPRVRYVARIQPPSIG